MEAEGKKESFFIYNYLPEPPKSGYPYTYLWFCPIHGQCYGFHLMMGTVGRKDLSFSMYKYLSKPPEDVFYDLVIPSVNIVDTLHLVSLEKIGFGMIYSMVFHTNVHLFPRPIPWVL